MANPKGLADCLIDRDKLYQHFIEHREMVSEEERVAFVWLADYVACLMLGLEYDSAFREMAQMLVSRAIAMLQGHDEIRLYPLYRLLYFLGRLSTSWFKEELPPPADLHSRLALIYHVQSVLDIHLKVDLQSV
jgi:hypothetical protein